MKTISLSQGKVALVDDADYPMIIRQGVWSARDNQDGTWYAYRTAYPSHGSILMHRMILGITETSAYVNHLDHNGLNNQRNNLRVATVSQHNATHHYPARSSTKYRGVYPNKHGTTWRALVSKDSKVRYLGNFPTDVEAALAYDKAAKELHGDFATLNFPDE